MPDYGFPPCVCGSSDQKRLTEFQVCCSRCLVLLPMPKKRGGVRVGSGRPAGGGRWGAYQGKLKRVYVPESIALNLPDFVQSVCELLEDFEALTNSYSESPRKKMARDMVLQLKQIKELID